MSAMTTIQTSVADGVMTILLNRPDSLNAYNEAMSVELSAALKTAERDAGIRCVLLSGAGRAFCSGQDLAEIRERYNADNASCDLDFAAHLRQRFNPVVARLRGLEKPIVAAVNGVAAGAGASFAFACDLRIASSNASFVMAFVHVGLIPDSGATQTLLQHVGYARAAELCFLGEKLPAEEALRCGLVNSIAPDGELMNVAGELARKLAKMPTRAIGLTKRALNHAWSATLDSQLEYEAFLQSTAGATADHCEGVLAFLQKRKATYNGK